jgi:hypothetical protein
MKRWLQIGGILSGVVLIVFGVVVIVMGVQGRNTVQDELSQQKITGTPDMTPTAIAAEAKEAGLKNVSLPTCSVANQPIDNGTKAKCFAEYMRTTRWRRPAGWCTRRCRGTRPRTARARTTPPRR